MVVMAQHHASESIAEAQSTFPTHSLTRQTFIHTKKNVPASESKAFKVSRNSRATTWSSLQNERKRDLGATSRISDIRLLAVEEDFINSGV